MTDTLILLKKAKEVSLNMPLSTESKNSALKKMAECLMESTEEILTANQKDIKMAKPKAIVYIDDILPQELKAFIQRNFRQ